MNVIVACEYSGVVREEFRKRGHNAWSCDLLPAEDNSVYHYQTDVRRVLEETEGFWDLMIAHPPCTYLSRSSMRWLKDQPPLKSGKLVGQARRDALAEALEFFKYLLEAPVAKICIENPRSFLIPVKATQYIQPWQFGHGETKETGLWLKNLPNLVPTNIVEGRENRIHKMGPSKDRWKERSRTYVGIACAMAEQWG
jgi:hypothetical protein